MRYLRLGLSLRPVRGKSEEDQDYAYAMHIDGVQYVMNDGGTYEDTFDSTDMLGILKNMDAIANSDRHEKVKYIQNFICSSVQKHVWCEVSCDSQLGILFGTEDGEIAQLMMDFRDATQFEEYKKEVYAQLRSMGVSDENLPEIDPMETFILVPAAQEYDVLFDKFKLNGVVLDYLDDQGSHDEQ
jgi:hypothetical protein